ncbi:MAG: PDZ domain-containing protein [Fibromonadaceae bacterium]|jgi:membrane-associated protease RseP (regulator of RpoE activity)|nr:PDZ domain-containing protein [Fibromonadaceae bacterium]
MKKVLKSLFLAAALTATVTIAGESENFGGLGISIWTSKSGIKIAGVLPNSPASDIGLQQGDLIVSANGTELATVEPGNQVSLIRGEIGSSINLVVDRNGDVFSVSTKRMGISVQGLNAQEISDWYGKTQGLTAEEIKYLADKKVAEGYQLLGVMQYGMPIANSAENLNANAIQQVSMKKVVVAETEEQSVQQLPINNSENPLLVNAKGARVKKEGNYRAFRAR